MEAGPHGTTPWTLIEMDLSWDAAVQQALLVAMRQHSRAWGRQEGTDYVDLILQADPVAPWPEPWFSLTSDDIDTRAPSLSGLYLVGRGAPLLVGHTDDLRSRLHYHLRSPLSCLRPHEPLLFSVRPLEDRVEGYAQANRLVTRWEPRCGYAV